MVSTHRRIGASLRAMAAVIAIATVAITGGAYLIWGFNESAPSVAKQSPGLSPEDSLKATVTLRGGWLEEDFMFDDSAGWSCSGVIVEEDGDSLVIMTNRHCIGVDDIAHQQSNERPDIREYTLAVATHQSKEWRKVSHFAEAKAPMLDVALLRVPRGDMMRGVHYEVARIHGRDLVKRGQDLVAIGAPRTPSPNVVLRDTETFGRVSAVRSAEETGAHGLIQTDTTINRGNSGGPLFVVLAGRRHLVGLNTFSIKETVGLNFAFLADEYHAQDWKWFAATPEGAVAALQEINGVSARVAR